MIARQRLVGVIDVQATRAGAFKDYDRAMLSLIAGRVAAAIDNAQLYRRAERQYRTIRTLSRVSQRIRVDSRSRRTAEQGGVERPRPDQLRRVQHSAGGCGAAGAAAPLQHPLRPARQSRQHSAGQRNHRRGRDFARGGAGPRHDHRSALHRVASRHSFRDCRAADRAGSRDRRDESRKRAHRILHGRPCAHAEPAGSVGRDRGGERAPLSRDWRTRAAHAGRSARPRSNCRPCCCRRKRREVEGLEIAIGLRPAREISRRPLRFLRAHAIRTSRSHSAIRAARARPPRSTAPWSTAACARSRRAAAVRPS